MRYLCITPAIEEALKKELENYLTQTVKLEEIYRNSAGTNVSLIHPFEYFYATAQGAQAAQTPTNLFPSVTIIAESDNPIDEIAAKGEMKITRDLIDSLERELSLAADERQCIVSRETLDELKRLIGDKDSVYCVGYHGRNVEKISIEVWADNNMIKNRLYTIVWGFLQGFAAETMMKKYNVDIVSESIIGNRSGNYNFDFGKTLFGGVISFEARYYEQSLYFDEEQEKTLGTNEIISGGALERF